MRAVSIQSPSSSRSATQAMTTAARDWIKASSKATFSAAHASSDVSFGFVMNEVSFFAHLTAITTSPNLSEGAT